MPLNASTEALSLSRGFGVDGRLAQACHCLYCKFLKVTQARHPQILPSAAVLMLFECYKHHMTPCFTGENLNDRDATTCQGLSPSPFPLGKGSLLPSSSRIASSQFRRPFLLLNSVLFQKVEHKKRAYMQVSFFGKYDPREQE